MVERYGTMSDPVIFDLYDFFVNSLVGDLTIAIALATILIWVVGIKTKMPMMAITLLNIILVGGLYGLAYAEPITLTIWAFTILGIGALFYYTLSKALR